MDNMAKLPFDLGADTTCSAEPASRDGVLWSTDWLAGFCCRRCEQLQSQADLAARRRELLFTITRLEDFASCIKDELQHAD
ncbi:MAG: hypothetical protein JO099_19105 [Acidobacteriia bacterium]|nr:hypothetical protein [Terriglobia bacterium]